MARARQAAERYDIQVFPDRFTRWAGPAPSISASARRSVSCSRIHTGAEFTIRGEGPTSRPWSASTPAWRMVTMGGPYDLVMPARAGRSEQRCQAIPPDHVAQVPVEGFVASHGRGCAAAGEGEAPGLAIVHVGPPCDQPRQPPCQAGVKHLCGRLDLAGMGQVSGSVRVLETIPVGIGSVQRR